MPNLWPRHLKQGHGGQRFADFSSVDGSQTSLDAAMAVLGGLLLLTASVWARQHPSRVTRVLSGLLALTLVVGTVQLSPLLADEPASDAAPPTHAPTNAPPRS